jgi:hypothetical protein
MQNDSAPQIESGTGAGHVNRASGPKLLVEQRLNISGKNAPGRQFIAVPRFWQEGLAPQLFACALDRFLERQVLESVQRIVVDENADGALRRQQT